MSNANVSVAEIPTGTVTFLFTDIEGSTRLWEQFPEQMAANLLRHDALLRQAIEAHGGYIFKTVGDQFCATFALAHEALSAAMMTQRALANEKWPGPEIKVRVGIHSGSAEERGGDYFGPTVNRAARLMAIGHGGQTLLSATALQLSGDRIPSQAVVQDLGHHRLKDLRQPEHVYQLNIQGLAGDFPPLKSLTAVDNNLPLQVTDFVGRAKELVETKRVLERSRLLTIVGPGGIGKSRLSLELAADLANHFRHGVFFVPLAPVASADLVAEAVAQSIGFSLASADPPDKQLLRHLANKNQLLVLDNMEHIIEAAELVNGILRTAPEVKVIATSREKLNLSGESVFPLSGLVSESWESLTAALENEALQLFVDTARQARHDFKISAGDLDVLRTIIEMIQGSPLGIVLAASWIDILSLQEIATEIGRSFDFLETELRDIPERQRSARATFDYSWRLLSEEERELFAALAIFRGGFTRAAAQDVAGASLRDLARLADKSLIGLDTETNRYYVHELLRQYGEARLKADQGRCEMIRDAQARFFALLVFIQRQAIYRGDHSAILVDLDNIRAAWRWAVERRLLEQLRVMIWPLGWFYDLRAYHAEAAAVLSLAVDALRMPEPEGLQGIVYGNALANYAIELMKLEGADRAAPMVREGLNIMRRLGAGEDLAWTQMISGWAFQDPQEIEPAFLESLAIFEAQNNPYGTAFTLLMLSWYYREQGRYEEARSSIQRGLEISHSLGDPESRATALRQLGRLNLHLGDYESAQSNFWEERELWRELGLPRPAGEASRNLGYAYLFNRDSDRAEEVFVQSLEEFNQAADEANAFWSLLGLAQVGLQQERAEIAQGFLEKAGEILKGRQDSEDQALWWQLSGRLALLRGKPVEVRQALDRALEYSQQASDMDLIRTVVEFACWYQGQNDMAQAARLLGFAQSQVGLPADLIQWRIEPLIASVAAAMDEGELSSLLEEGASLDRQAIVDGLS